VISIKVDIVGGGIAGLSTAISIKQRKKSIDVVVHEKHKKIGYNTDGRRCGEAHSIEHYWDKPEWFPNKKSVYNNISKAEMIFEKKSYVYDRKPNSAFVLNRQEFIVQLLNLAKKLGAEINTNDRVKSINDLDGKYIVDASGIPSPIKKELGLKSGIKGYTYQQTLEDSNWFYPDRIKIFFPKYVGYFWIFPRNPEKNEINFGMGYFGKPGQFNLKEQLEKFKLEKNIKGKINHQTGGLIPCGITRPVLYNNILFVGDSGVGAFPLTGQGIYRALMSGDFAGIAITNDNPKQYIRLVNKAFVKWDVVGKNIIRTIKFLLKLHPTLAYFAYSSYTKFGHATH
jgi:flavin-dependent dehydrogenase